MVATRLLVTLALLTVAACAPSPLYVGERVKGTPGTIPRDGRGEPIWSAIPPAPPVPPPPPITFEQATAAATQIRPAGATPPAAATPAPGLDR